MDAKSEVILRQQLPCKLGTLLVNPPQDTLYQQFSDCQIWTWNYADHSYFLAQHFVSHFAINPPQAQFAQVIIFVPKAKQQLNYVLDQCAALLKTGQQIFLVGEKKSGIEGFAKQLIPFGKTLKLDSARHCQLWQLNLAEPHQPQSLSSWLQHYAIEFAGKRLSICALPGVFSQQKLDIGTQQLLPYLPAVLAGEILDFGCGAGVIAALLASQNPNYHLTAADVDAFALHSTELTFAANGLSDQLSTLAVADIQDIDKQFDAIISNPPFHQGIKTHYQASENLCLFAFDQLKANGELWIVANRFLNYAPFIEKRFAHCHLKADQNGFKVLYAKKTH